MLNSGFLLLSRLGFGIPISSRILDSLSCIPDFTKKVPGFQISLANIFPDSGIWIALHMHKAISETY